jgi:LysM repeat protein
MPPMKSPCLFRTRSSRTLAAVCLLALAGLAAVPHLEAQSLLGSRTSLLRQNEMARQHDYTYLRTSDQVHEFARRGLLVRLSGSSSYRLAAVSFPYARPEVKTFIERLGSQYRAACGERLVVTSLTRPLSRQPHNASHLSVHPTGMAVDLRRSNRSSCRRWLEKTLLTMEARGLVEATRERHPPHYHVTLFPKPYMRYLASKGVEGETVLASGETKSYRVGRGDSLWTIARRHGTSVSSLKKANGISSSRLKPGQVLEIPVTR